MSLPTKAVDRIFERLTATYGRAFIAQWDGVPEQDVKTVWGHELAGFGESRELMGHIAWALENLPEAAPNAIKFRNLCRQSPAAPLPRLDAPKADPERVAAEMSKLAPVRAVLAGGAGGVADPKAWARRIVARHGAGERINYLPLRMARQALGLEA